MKPQLITLLRKRSILTLCVCWLFFAGASAQTTAGHYNTKTYDTLLSGPGYGNYNIRFPQWNPVNGTLASVKVNVNISVQYGFTLKNVDVSSSNYSLKIGREDYFSSAALSADFDTVIEKTIGVYPLSAGSSTTMNPFAFMNGLNISDSIAGAVTPFLGTGTVSFLYAPVTYTTLRSSNNSSYSYQATANDQMRFSITYTYTPPVLLASQIIAFNAILQAGQRHSLVSWAMVNEREGMVYEVERSTDGVNFTAVGQASYSAANGGYYSFLDSLPPGSGDRYYYRLKVSDENNEVYSNVVVVTRLAIGGGMRIWPNPVDDLLNVDLPAGAQDGSWQLEILTAAGARVMTMQHKGFHLLQILLDRRIATGVYFIKATDLATGASSLLSFLKK